MTLPYGAVLFDCDGTLVDSESVVSGVMSDVARDHGLDVSPEEYRRDFAGVPMPKLVAEFERRLGHALPPRFVPRLRERMADAFREEIRPMPGAVETVFVVEQAGLPFAVVSGGPQAKIQLNLELVGLLEAFEGRIFSCYDDERHKPDPSVMLRAAAALDVDPAECLVIEDSPTGFATARAAGMRYVALDVHGRYADEAGHAVAVVPRIDGVLPILGLG